MRQTACKRLRRLIEATTVGQDKKATRQRYQRLKSDYNRTPGPARGMLLHSLQGVADFLAEKRAAETAP